MIWLQLSSRFMPWLVNMSHSKQELARLIFSIPAGVPFAPLPRSVAALSFSTSEAAYSIPYHLPVLLVLRQKQAQSRRIQLVNEVFRPPTSLRLHGQHRLASADIKRSHLISGIQPFLSTNIHLIPASTQH
ncbi:hypothetical protein ACQY0O_003605 [Thecaphora frezii]